MIKKSKILFEIGFALIGIGIALLCEHLLKFNYRLEKIDNFEHKYQFCDIKTKKKVHFIANLWEQFLYIISGFCFVMILFGLDCIIGSKELEWASKYIDLYYSK